MEITYRTFWMTPSFGTHAELSARTFTDQDEAIKQSKMWDKMITKAKKWDDYTEVHVQWREGE